VPARNNARSKIEADDVCTETTSGVDNPAMSRIYGFIIRIPCLALPRPAERQGPRD